MRGAGGAPAAPAEEAGIGRVLAREGTRRGGSRGAQRGRGVARVGMRCEGNAWRPLTSVTPRLVLAHFLNYFLSL